MQTEEKIGTNEIIASPKANKYLYTTIDIYKDFPVDKEYVMPANFVEYIADFIQNKQIIIEELNQLKDTIIEYKKDEILEVEDPKTGEFIEKTRRDIFNPDELEENIWDKDRDGNKIHDISLPLFHHPDNLKLISPVFYVSNGKFKVIRKMSEIDLLKQQLMNQYSLNNDTYRKIFIKTDDFIDDIIVNIPKYNFFNATNADSLPQHLCSRRPFDSMFALPICAIMQNIRNNDIKTIEQVKQYIVTVLKNTIYSIKKSEYEDTYKQELAKHKALFEKMYLNLHEAILQSGDKEAIEYAKKHVSTFKIYQKNAVKEWSKDFNDVINEYKKLSYKLPDFHETTILPDCPKDFQQMFRKKWRLSDIDKFKELEQYETPKLPNAIRKGDFGFGNFILSLYNTYNSLLNIQQAYHDKTISEDMFNFFEQSIRFSSYIGHASHNFINKTFNATGGAKTHLSEAETYITNTFINKYLMAFKNKPKMHLHEIREVLIKEKNALKRIVEKMFSKLFEDLNYLSLYPEYKQIIDMKHKFGITNEDIIIDSLDIKEKDPAREKYITKNLESIKKIIEQNYDFITDTIIKNLKDIKHIK